MSERHTIEPGSVIALPWSSGRHPDLVVSASDTARFNRVDVVTVDDMRETSVWTDEFDDTEFVGAAVRRIAP